MIRRPPRSTQSRSSAASDVYKRQVVHLIWGRQRLLTREAGTSAHIDAVRDGKEKKYEDDRKGYIELYDYFLQKNPNAAR